jgi:hypothetical protein
MAHKTESAGLPFTAASGIAQWVPVQALQGGSALKETVIRNGSWNVEALGFTLATVASPGDPVAVVVDGIVKGTAGASLGTGARVAVGSTNGILVPINASGVASPASTGEARYSVGKSLYNAVAGDVISVLVDPSQIV